MNLSQTRQSNRVQTVKKVLISACLLGVKCRHNGRDSKSDEAMEKLGGDELVPVCPEQLGGLSTPRPPAEIVGGDGADVLDGCASVITVEGQDKTSEFLGGAHQTLEIAKSHHATHAVLKSKSPSCGCGQIYDGTFTGEIGDGDGVTAALLRRQGIQVMTEADIETDDSSQES